MEIYFFFGGLFVMVILFGVFAFFEARAYNEYMEEKMKDESCKDTIWASLMPPDLL